MVLVIIRLGCLALKTFLKIMIGYYSKIEQNKLGLKKIGKDCLISKLSRFISKDVVIGDRCRIDDDVVCKGKIRIGNNVHLGRGCTISGGDKGVYIDEYSALSNFVQIFTISDHYSTSFVPSATLSDKLKKFSHLISKKVIVGKAVLLGAFSVILPGAELEDYTSVGAHSVVLEKVKKGNFFNSNNLKKTTKMRAYKNIEKRVNLLNKKLK